MDRQRPKPYFARPSFRSRADDVVRFRIDPTTTTLRVDILSFKAFPYWPADLRLSKIEIAIMRAGPVVNGVTGFEYRTIGHAGTEHFLQVRLSRDEIISIGDVNPLPQICREPRRLWSEPLVSG